MERTRAGGLGRTTVEQGRLERTGAGRARADGSAQRLDAAEASELNGNSARELILAQMPGAAGRLASAAGQPVRVSQCGSASAGQPVRGSQCGAASAGQPVSALYAKRWALPGRFLMRSQVPLRLNSRN